MIDEIECPDCDGMGRIYNNNNDPLGRQYFDCEECGGTGWREPTQDEADNMAEDAYWRQFEGEPPLSAQERHEAAWKQKQELRR